MILYYILLYNYNNRRKLKKKIKIYYILYTLKQFTLLYNKYLFWISNSLNFRFGFD